MILKIRRIFLNSTYNLYKNTSVLSNNYYDCPKCKENNFYLADNKQKGMCVCGYDMSRCYFTKTFPDYSIEED